jgi:hypothetical protein
MNYKCYIIFHKKLYEECYKDLSNTSMNKIQFIGVNSKIQKTIPESLKDKIILEKELVYYYPLYQFSNFCESSVFYHVVKNSQLLLDPYDYVGFFQYDMILKPELFEIIKPTNSSTIYYLFKENSYRHLAQGIDLIGWKQILQMYNILFEKNHQLETILLGDIPLYHCYILPKDIFRKMMYFNERVFPYLFEMLGLESKHLPYHLERCHGIFLELQRLEGNLTNWIQMPGVIHTDNLKDPWQK